jgi:glycosyltransferase involved in cell wall biosynthesis
MMNNRKILFISNADWFFWGHALQVARAARDSGCQVYVLAKISQDSERFASEGFILLPWSIRRGSLNPVSECDALLQVVRTCRDLRPDLIHGLSLKQAVYGGIAGRVLGIPTLSAITGLGHVFAAKSLGMRALRRVLLALLRLSQRAGSAVLTVENSDDLELLVDSRAVQPDRALVIRGAGVNTEFYVPQPEAEGVPVVALASRLLWYKGVGEFCAAADILRREGIGARFVLIGDNDPQNPSSVPTEQLESWHESGTLELWGRYVDMRKAFAEAHIICLPTFYREGIPKVLLEAAAAGRPIVTTDVPGCRDIVHHNENGLLVPPRDATALASALRRLITDKQLRLALGRRGRERAVSEFRMELVINDTLRLYADLTRRNGSQPGPYGCAIRKIKEERSGTQSWPLPLDRSK